MNTKQQQSGVTIIELLVVISVMALLMVLMIPQVRMITKDRSIREAARIVGTTLSEASNRAVLDGFSGVALVRNGNLTRNDATNGNEIFYASYEILQLRQPPSYSGNQVGDGAIVTITQPQNRLGDPGDSANFGLIAVTIPAPLEPSININSGFVRLNGTKTKYRIVGPGVGGIVCEVPLHLEMPPETGAAVVPFELIRTPVIKQTSLVDLPRGYMINLNYSGPVDFPSIRTDLDEWSWTEFSQSVPNTFQTSPLIDAADPIYIIFDNQGGIDRIYPNGWNSVPFYPEGSIHFCICPDEVKHSFQPTQLSDARLAATPNDVLDDPTVKWISLNHTNGSVVVSDTAVPTTPCPAASSATLEADVAIRILEALGITGKRQAATQ